MHLEGRQKLSISLHCNSLLFSEMCCNVHGQIYGLMEPCFKGLWYENTARTDKHVTKIKFLVNQFST